MVLIICKSLFLSGQYADSSSVFLLIKTLVEIGCAATQMDHSNTSSKILFHGLPNKSKCPSIRKQIALSISSQLIGLLFLQNIYLQRDIQQAFFCQCFCKLLENSYSASKKGFLEIFRKFTKNTHGESYFSKVAGFYRSSHWRCSVKKDVLRKMLAKFTGKHLSQRLYFNKVAGLDSGTSVFL